MNQEGVDFKEMCQWLIKSGHKGKVLTGPLSVIVELYFKDERKRDVDNFNKIIFRQLFWVVVEGR